MNQAIVKSLETNKIVSLKFADASATSNAMKELKSAADDHANNDFVARYWGETETGKVWCVHIWH